MVEQIVLSLHDAQNIKAIKGYDTRFDEQSTCYSISRILASVLEAYLEGSERSWLSSYTIAELLKYKRNPLFDDKYYHPTTKQYYYIEAMLYIVDDKTLKLTVRRFNTDTMSDKDSVKGNVVIRTNEISDTFTQEDITKLTSTDNQWKQYKTLTSIESFFKEKNQYFTGTLDKEVF